MILLEIVKYKIDKSLCPEKQVKIEAFFQVVLAYLEKDTVGKVSKQEKQDRLVKGRQLPHPVHAGITGGKKKPGFCPDFAPREKTAELADGQGQKRRGDKIIDHVAELLLLDGGPEIKDAENAEKNAVKGKTRVTVDKQEFQGAETEVLEVQDDVHQPAHEKASEYAVEKGVENILFLIGAEADKPPKNE